MAQSVKEVAEWVKIVKLPGLPKKGDVSNYLDAGGTAQTLGQLVYDTKEFDATSADDGELEELHQDLGLMTVAQIRESLSSAPRWLVDKMLTRDGVSIFVSRPGVGKSTLARQF